MSRIGDLPIEIPDGVEVTLDGLHVAVSGPNGDLEQQLPEGLAVEHDDDEAIVVVRRLGETRKHRSRHGLARSLIVNMVEGVTDGYEKRLEMHGVGYRAEPAGDDLRLEVGLSHPVIIEAPESITFETPEPTRIVVRGPDKALVGQVAADIRAARPPEPYKGKGIRYEGERIRRKAGKAAAR